MSENTYEQISPATNHDVTQSMMRGRLHAAEASRLLPAPPMGGGERCSRHLGAYEHGVVGGVAPETYFLSEAPFCSALEFARFSWPFSYMTRFVSFPPSEY